MNEQTGLMDGRKHYISCGGITRQHSFYHLLCVTTVTQHNDVQFKATASLSLWHSCDFGNIHKYLDLLTTTHLWPSQRI